MGDYAGRRTTGPRPVCPGLEALEDRLLLAAAPLSPALPAKTGVAWFRPDFPIAGASAQAETEAVRIWNGPGRELEREVARESLRHGRTDGVVKERPGFATRLAILDALYSAGAALAHAAASNGREAGGGVTATSVARPIPAAEPLRPREPSVPHATDRPAAIASGPPPAGAPAAESEAPSSAACDAARRNEVPPSEAAEPVTAPVPSTAGGPSLLAGLRDALPLQEPAADLAALRRDLDAVFTRLDRLTPLPAGLPSPSRLLVWVAAASAGLELVRRQARRRAVPVPPGDVLIDSVFSLPETE
jgi:hypothetical protein